MQLHEEPAAHPVSFLDTTYDLEYVNSAIVIDAVEAEPNLDSGITDVFGVVRRFTCAYYQFYYCALGYAPAFLTKSTSQQYGSLHDRRQ